MDLLIENDHLRFKQIGIALISDAFLNAIPNTIQVTADLYQNLQVSFEAVKIIIEYVYDRF
jgi:hypothetical protein